MSGLLVGLCALMLFLFPDAAMESARASAQVFVAGVMPALFPMMVLCRLLPCPAHGEHSHAMAGATVFSFLSGSPASAQRVRLLNDAGLVPVQRLLPLLCVCGVMSPMFFVGTLAGWTGLRAAMWAMLAVHWVGALIVGGLLYLCSERLQRRRAARQRMSGQPLPAARSQPRISLTEAITLAAQSLLAVCGAMMLFSIAAGVLRAALLKLFPGWVAQKPLAVAWALLEIGGGASAVLEAWETPPLVLLSGLCAFGGLSIWMQNLLFVSKCIRPMKLLWVRVLHGAVCMALSHAVFSVFPVLRQTFAAGGAVRMAEETAFSPLLPALLIWLACLAPRRAS